MRHPMFQRFVRFRRDESGAVTIEAVLWLPFFFALLVLIADVSFAFYAKAQAYRVIENGNRSYAAALPAQRSTTATANWIRTSLAGLSPTADVETRAMNGLVSTTVVLPSDDILMFDWLESFGGFEVTVRAQQYVE